MAATPRVFNSFALIATIEDSSPVWITL
jgi:hypothetical protein